MDTNPENIHKALEIFYELQEKFPNLLDISFNIFLVMIKTRKATLVEYANFINNTEQWYILKSWIIEKIINQNNPDIMILDEKLKKMHDGHEPRYLIFHRDHLQEAKSAILDMNKAMGNILGFHQAGCLDCQWSLEFFLIIGDKKEQIYAETCEKEPDKSFIDMQLKKFSDAAKLIEGIVNYNTRYRPSYCELMDNLNEPDIDFFVNNDNHRDALANTLSNNCFDITSELIFNSSRDTLITLLKTYHKFWQFIIYRQIRTRKYFTKDELSEKLIEEIFYKQHINYKPESNPKITHNILKIMSKVKKYDINIWRYFTIIINVIPASELSHCIRRSYECVHILFDVES